MMSLFSTNYSLKMCKGFSTSELVELWEYLVLCHTRRFWKMRSLPRGDRHGDGRYEITTWDKNGQIRFPFVSAHIPTDSNGILVLIRVLSSCILHVTSFVQMVVYFISLDDLKRAMINGLRQLVDK